MMKRRILLFVCFSFVLSVGVIDIDAKEKSVPQSNDTCNLEISTDDEEIPGYITNKKYNSNGELASFDVIISISEAEMPEVETRGVVSMIVTIYKTCKIAGTMGAGFNPCTYLAMALGRKIVDGTVNWKPEDRGDWRVSRTSHYGYKPGCEPRHSQSCNGFYYTYSYYKVK